MDEPFAIALNYRAVIFDLDGTLLDTIEDLADSMNAVLEQFHFPSHGVEAYKYFVGDGIEALVERALPRDNRDRETLRTCLQAMRQEYGRRWDEKTRPYEGIEELLAELGRMGVRMAVLSNKPDESTRIAVRKMLPRVPFDIVLGARPDFPKKPDPAAALEIAGALGLSAGECLYVGDTATDIRTAVAASMTPVGVLWGFREAGELLAAGAKVLIRKPSELLHIIGARKS